MSRVISVCGVWMAVFLLLSARTASAGGASASAAVVKVYVAALDRDLWAPWRPGTTESRTGSGAFVAQGLVLTAAHVIEDATFVQVRRNGAARKVTAQVLFVSHAADLALLQVADPAFSEGVTPLELGTLPAVQGEVEAYGFPNGGETLSITRGVVARVETWKYVHSGEQLLSFQMDAAIDPGSSGGPVVAGGRIAGVAMQGFKDSAIGSAVPVPVIRQFLEDVADGRLDGIPALGVEVQSLENPALKESVGLPAGETGVVVRHTSARGGGLREGDVLLALGGIPIGDDGSVELRPGERTALAHVTDCLQLGASVAVRYLRDGVAQEGLLKLDRARGQGALVPRLFDRGPDYFLYGGLAFVTVTQNLLNLTKEWTPPHLAALVGVESDDERQEVVLLADILASEVNSGYGNERFEVVSEVDGQKIRGLADLVRIVEAPSTRRYVSFGLSGGFRVTVSREEVAASGRGVLERYGVAADRSPRLQSTLAARAPRP